MISSGDQLMDKSHFHGLVILHIKVVYCVMAALGLIVIAALDLMDSQYRFAMVASAFALLLLIYAVYLLLRGNNSSAIYGEWCLVGLLCIFTLFGMQRSTQVVHWIYFVPAFFYFVFSLRTANWMVVFYSIAVIGVISQQFPSHLQVQMIATYLACVAFSGFNAVIDERANRGLGDTIDTDPLTNVYSERQLYSDLKKEITRSDRQGSELTLIAITAPAAWRTLKVEEYQPRLGYFGSKLNRCLRHFDTCYRLENDDFLILMPDCSDRACERLCEDLMDDLTGSDRYQYLTDIRVVKTQYQPGEDHQTLLQRLLSQVPSSPIGEVIHV